MNATGAVRPVGALFRGLSKNLKRTSGAGTRTGATAKKAGAEAAGKALAGALSQDETLREEVASFKPQGIETFLFKQLPRPRLTEMSASDLGIDDAEEYARQSSLFYDFDFPLFARGDFFYEEVEEDFLNQALGKENKSVDRRFLDVMTLFRQTLNQNTRALLMIWMPLVFTAAMMAGAVLSSSEIAIAVLASFGFGSELAMRGALFLSAMLAGFGFVFLLFSWPFKVVQQRNLMNLDNYITSKFARINHNFQVAKRRALNVERDKRMSQRDDLKAEAGSWTLSYHWFAMRLFLCELVIRNKFYQVRRNTTLYWAGGVFFALSGLAAVLTGAALYGTPAQLVIAMGVAGALSLIAIASVLSRVAAMMFRVVEAHEWSRFHLVRLNNTISDHVAEDKVQIVTFRDRNRFE